MYFKWTVSDSYPDSLWLEYDYAGCIDPGVFRGGIAIRKAPGPLRFKAPARSSVSRIRKHDYLMSDATELVSAQLKELIEGVARGNCQFFPAELKVGKVGVDGYYVINVTKRCPCIDMAKSRYKPMIRGELGPPFDFSKLVMLPGSLGARHLVRAEQDDEMVVVDRVFVDACRSATIRGCDFEPL